MNASVEVGNSPSGILPRTLTSGQPRRASTSSKSPVFPVRHAGCSRRFDQEIRVKCSALAETRPCTQFRRLRAARGLETIRPFKGVVADRIVVAAQFRESRGLMRERLGARDRTSGRRSIDRVIRGEQGARDGLTGEPIEANRDDTHVSRRRFLATAAVAGSGLATAALGLNSARAATPLSAPEPAGARLATDVDVYDTIGQTLETLARQGTIAPHRPSGVGVVRIVVTDPGAEMTLFLSEGGPGSLNTGKTRIKPDATVTVDAQTAHEILSGQGQVALALAHGAMTIEGDRRKLVPLVSLPLSATTTYAEKLKSAGKIEMTKNWRPIGIAPGEWQAAEVAVRAQIGDPA